MYVILLVLLVIFMAVCVISVKVGVFPELIEIHIFWFVKIKIKNKEKRPEDVGTSPRRIGKK